MLIFFMSYSLIFGLKIDELLLKLSFKASCAFLSLGINNRIVLLKVVDKLCKLPRFMIAAIPILLLLCFAVLLRVVLLVKLLWRYYGI